MKFNISRILKQPYPLYLEFSKTFPAILGISIFVIFFLYFFKPFGLTDSDIAQKKLFLSGFGFIVFIILSFNVYVLPRFLPTVFNEDNWTLAKEILWILWNVFACISASAMFEFIQPDCPFTLPQLLQGYFQGFLVAIIPVTIIVLLVHMSLLKTRLRRAEKISKKLQSSSGEKEQALLRFDSETGTENVNIPPKDLLFIQSSDNYSTIIWQEGSQIQKAMLRSTLKRLEDQISSPNIVRCHRSFIVNLASAYSVTGNANGYKLYLKNHSDPIPVARRYGKQVLQILNRLTG